MILDRLEVENVRNIVSASLDLSPRLNIIHGPNGAGKSALLEAVHILVRGRSFRSSTTDSVVRIGSDALTIRADVCDSTVGNRRIALHKGRRQNTTVRLDGEAVKQTSTLASLVPLQVFLPNLSDLVFGAPSLRRQWLDWGTFHVKPDYLQSLRDYLRALKQRNAVLKSSDQQALDIWTQQLVELGETVTAQRAQYVESIRSSVLDCLARLDPDLGIELEFDAGWSGETLADELRLHLPRDVKLGATQRGPHRADIRIRARVPATSESSSSAPEAEPNSATDFQVEDDGSRVDYKGVGEVESGTEEQDSRRAAQTLSRGQGKMVASAMRVAQAQGLADEQGQKSVFLIDDAGAELDEDHNIRFFGLLDDIGPQILATTTRGDALAEAYPRDQTKTFHVKRGAIATDERNDERNDE